MKSIFISDAHIGGLYSKNQYLLCSFLDSIKDDTERLVILGDLFDFWFGLKGVVFYGYLPVLNKLLELKQNGIKIIYVEGNHDFFMGPFFTSVLGADVYPDKAELSFDDRRVFLAHGDVVNKKDYGYRLLRWFLRGKLFFIMANIIHPSLLFRIAKRFSGVSRNYLGKGHPLETVLRDFALEKWRTGYDVVILSHSHSPEFLIDDKGNKLYVNLGDWVGSFTYLEYDKGEFKLKKFDEALSRNNLCKGNLIAPP